MEIEATGPGLILLYVQIFGTALFALVFLFLWRQSGIRYFEIWSVAWVLQCAALICALFFFKSKTAAWLAPYALFEFAFGLSLIGAARVSPSAQSDRWKLPARLLLLGFPVFLLLIYVLGLHARFEGYHALQALVLGAIYSYNYATLRGQHGIGGKLFRFSLLCLSIAFLQHAAIFFYLHYTADFPRWMGYLSYDRMFNFAFHTLLAFSAMAMWIESQNDRVTELGDELDRVRKESMANLDLDHLTGLLNHSALVKRMEDQETFEGVVVVCDIDNFKQVNDRYGHLVGDEILRNIGHLLLSSIRREDEAFRWGGDEFVMLFRGQNADVVANRMQAIRARLSDFRVRGHGAVPISFSWGTVEAAGDTLRQILNQADQAMYRFKRLRSSRRA